MSAPNIWTLQELAEIINTTSVEIDGKWVPARPLGLEAPTSRLRIAWLVFTGVADAVLWPEGQ